MKGFSGIPHELFWDLEEIIRHIGDDFVELNTGYTHFLSYFKKSMGISVLPYRFLELSMYDSSRWKTKIWLLPKKEFINYYPKFFDQVKIKYQKWQNVPIIFKLYCALKDAYRKNTSAHTTSRRPLKSHYYSQKSFALSKAVFYASQINNPEFSFGYQRDEMLHYTPFIIYFQFKKEQISFHSDCNYDLPIFNGTWNGVRNESFPLSEANISSISDKTQIIEPSSEYWKFLGEFEEFKYLPLDEILELFSKKAKQIANSKENDLNSNYKINEIASNPIKKPDKATYKPLNSFIPNLILNKDL